MAAGTAPWIFGTNQVLSSDKTPNVNVKYVEGLVLRHPIQNQTAKETIARGDNPVVENLIELAGHGNSVKAKTALEAFCDTGELPANVAPQPPSSGTKIPLLAPGQLEQLVKNGQCELILKTIANNKQLLEEVVKILNRSAIDWYRAPETYRAPEVLIKDKQYIEASDILSLGVVLHQLLENLLLESMFPPPRKESTNPIQLVQELLNNNNTSSSTALCSQRGPGLLRIARQLLDLLSAYTAGKKPEQLLGDQFEVKNGLLGVPRDVFFFLLKHAYARDDDLVRNLMGVSGESIGWTKHPYHAFAALYGKVKKENHFKNICRIAREMSTAEQIRRSNDLRNGDCRIRDTMLIGEPYLLPEAEEVELREIIQGWEDAKTPEERKPLIQKLAGFYEHDRIPIVRDPVLQQKLWYLFPYIGVVQVWGCLPPGVPKTPNGVDMMVISLLTSIDTDTIPCDQCFNPKAIALYHHHHHVSELVEAGIQFEHANTLVIDGYGIDNPLLGCSPDIVERCFPNLEVIYVVPPLVNPSSEAQLEEMLNKLKVYGKIVNIIVPQPQHDVGYNVIAYVHEYRLDDQGNLVLKETREARGSEHLYWTK
jgi:hypothetical protein